MAGFFCPDDGQTFEEKPIGGRCPVHGAFVKPIPDAPEADEIDEETPEEETPGPAARF